MAWVRSIYSQTALPETMLVIEARESEADVTEYTADKEPMFTTISSGETYKDLFKYTYLVGGRITRITLLKPCKVRRDTENFTKAGTVLTIYGGQVLYFYL